MAVEEPLISKWLTFIEIVTQLTLGDLLEFKRGIYTHWAVYIGPIGDIPKVIHFSTPDGDFGGVNPAQAINVLGRLSGTTGIISGTDKAAIRCDNLEDVAGDDLLRINHDMDRHHSHFCRNLIVERAQYELDSSNYSIVLNNCEHFAKYCRYGKKVSDQVEISKKVGVSVAVGVLGTLGTVIIAPVSGAIALGATAGTGTYAVWSGVNRIRRAQKERMLHGVN